MEQDPKRRGIAGVVCSIVDLGNGKSRVVLDDVSNTGSELGPWNHELLYTHKDYDSNDLENLELSEEEYAAFGHAIFARLCAIKKHPYKK